MERSGRGQRNCVRCARPRAWEHDFAGHAPYPSGTRSAGKRIGTIAAGAVAPEIRAALPREQGKEGADHRSAAIGADLQRLDDEHR